MQGYTDICLFCEWSWNKLGLLLKAMQILARRGIPSKSILVLILSLFVLLIGSRSEMASIQSKQGTALRSKQLRMGSYGIFHGSLSYHSICGGLNPAQGYLFSIEKLRKYSCFNSLCLPGPNKPGLTINPLKSCVCWPISAQCHIFIFYSLISSSMHSNKGADGTKTFLSPVWK